MLVSCMINYGGTVVTGYTEEGCDASQERPMPAFTSFTTSGPFNVYYVQSQESKVLVEGKEEFLDKVITEMDDETLLIKLEKGTYHNLVLKVTVFSPVADNIKSAGSGNLVDNQGHSSAKEIEYKVAGSGDLYLVNVSSKTDIDIASAGSGDVYAENIACEDLEVSMAGSGDLDINGLTVKDLDVKVAGSGDAKVTSATIRKDADFAISGSGDIRVDAEVGDEISAKTAGSGNITLNGSCNEIEATTSGSGDISGNLQYNRISTTSKGSGKVRL